MTENRKTAISRREFLKVASAGAAGLALASCAPAATPEPEPEATEVQPTAAPKEPVTITYWTWHPHGEDVAQAFMETHPDIQVDVTVGNPWDLQDKMIAAVAAGSGAPDVGRMVGRMFYRFAGPGKGTLDLTERVEEFRDGCDDWAWALGSAGDRVYGLPSEYGATGLYYRKDIFDEMGFEPPKTWSEYIEQGKTYKQETGKGYMPMWIPCGQWGSETWRIHLQARDGNIFDADDKLIENNELARETLRWYYDLHKEQDICHVTQYWSPDFVAAMQDDHIIAWAFNGGTKIWIETQVPEMSGQWSRAPWPLVEGVEGSHNAEQGSTIVTIFEQGDHIEEAWEYAKYYAITTEGQIAKWKAGGEIPTWKPALETSEANAPEEFWSGTTLSDFLGDRTTPVFRYVQYAEAATILGDEIDDMWDNRTPEEAWDRAENKIKEAGFGV